MTGDSGGPLMCGGVQDGVVSYVYTCGRNVTPANPVVYVRVAHYVQWIDQTIRNHSRPIPVSPSPTKQRVSRTTTKKTQDTTEAGDMGLAGQMAHSSGHASIEARLTNASLVVLVMVSVYCVSKLC